VRVLVDVGVLVDVFCASSRSAPRRRVALEGALLARIAPP
jgi:hypothetical protein